VVVEQSRLGCSRAHGGNGQTTFSLQEVIIRGGSKGDSLLRSRTEEFAQSVRLECHV